MSNFYWFRSWLGLLEDQNSKLWLKWCEIWTRFFQEGCSIRTIVWTDIIGHFGKNESKFIAMIQMLIGQYHNRRSTTNYYSEWGVRAQGISITFCDQMIWFPTFGTNLLDHAVAQFLSLINILNNLNKTHFQKEGEGVRIWSCSKDGCFCLFFLLGPCKK